MDAIVPPGNTSLVTNDSDNRLRHCYNDNDEVLNRISTAAENVMNNDNANAHNASATAERLGLANLGSVERNGSEGRNNVDRNGSETRHLMREEGHESRDSVRHLNDSVERFGLKNLDATKDGFKDLLISMKDDLRDLLISNKNDFKDVLLKNCQVEKDVLLQFKDAQLIAMQNKADLAKQIAECCCEQKALTLQQGSETRDLIRSENEMRLREKVAHLEQQLLRSTIPPFPVAAVV